MSKIIIVFLALSLILCTAPTISASESALAASPAILETIVTPDQPNLTSITIQNTTNFPLPLKGSVSAFLATEDIPDSAKATFDASSWFTLEPSDLILQPKEVKEIKVSITPPRDAEPGGHYATIYFRPMIPQEAISQSNAISLARIGILAFLIIPGNIEEKIVASPLLSSQFQAFGPIKFVAHLENQGSVHVIPVTKVDIFDLMGKNVATLTHLETAILPHTTKPFDFSWNKTLGLGRYRAILTTTYGADQRTVVSQPIYFWLFPWPLILTSIGILTFLYKIFIVNAKRLKLAIRVLKGNYDPTKITQKNPRQHPRTDRRSHPDHTSSLRRPRRQPDRQ